MWWDKWVIDGLLNFVAKLNAAFQLSDPAFANRIVFQLRDADSARFWWFCWRNYGRHMQ